jgi:hypothetical protein
VVILDELANDLGPCSLALLHEHGA